MSQLTHPAPSTTLWKRIWPAVVILAAYLVVALLYAVFTPDWQVPDEPAHYNYVRTLAEEREFPVMEVGDYSQEYLQRLTTEGFPDYLPLEPLEYEDHQPPLYYLLSVPFYALGNGALLPMRLLSVLLGGVVVGMTMAIAREIFPDQPGLAWLAGGFVAFLPQHLVIMAGVNNDALTEALLATWLFLALRYLRAATPAWLLGGVLGLLLLTKTTGYVALPLAVVVVLLRWQRGGFSWQRALGQGALILGPALLLGLPWWARNVSVYGWPDLLGLMRHDEVVVGQPRTTEWLAREGAVPFLRALMRTTFQSFWGQPGWMGVVLDRRIYLGLGLLSVATLWSTLWHFVEALRSGLSPRQRAALTLLGSSAGLTLLLFLGYNLTFVQHQGRYLFPALPAIALAATLGLRRLTQKQLALATAPILGLLFLFIAVLGLIDGDLPLWDLVIVGLSAAMVAVAGHLPQRVNPLLGALLLLALFGLDLWVLFGFIVPFLTVTMP